MTLLSLGGPHPAVGDFERRLGSPKSPRELPPGKTATSTPACELLTSSAELRVASPHNHGSQFLQTPAPQVCGDTDIDMAYIELQYIYSIDIYM